jgi:hypothetical protein
MIAPDHVDPVCQIGITLPRCANYTAAHLTAAQTRRSWRRLSSLACSSRPNSFAVLRTAAAASREQPPLRAPEDRVRASCAATAALVYKLM